MVSSEPATTCALVTIRPGATAQPEPSTPRPQAVPSTRTTERRRGSTSGSVAIAASGAGHRRRRADYRRRRVDPVERVQDRPRRRQDLVEAAQDQRLLDVGAQARGSRRVQGDRAEDPGEPQRDRGDQRRTAGAVGQVQDGPADHLRPQAQRKALDRDCHQRPGDQRPKRGAERRVGGLGALGQEQRAEPAAGKCAEREADQGHRADDQSLPVTPQREGEGEGDDGAVENSHH